MTIFRFSLLRSLRRPLNLLIIGVVPPCLACMPFVPGATLPLGFSIQGLIMLFMGFLLARAVVEDGASGVLERIAAAPVSNLRYLTETLLAFSVILVVENAVFVAVGVLAHGDRLVAPAALFSMYCVFAVTAIGFSLAWCSLFRARATAYITLTVVIQIMGMIGGFYWPVSFMPRLMQRIAMITPCYWMMDAMEGIMRRAPLWPGIASSLGILVLFTVAFLLVGSRRRIA